MNKHICISNETFPKAVNSIDELSFLHIAHNIVLSTICVILFHMKRPPRLIPLSMDKHPIIRSANTTITQTTIGTKQLTMT